MEEIKVGEYVRTKEGFIAKCKEIDEDKEYYEFDKCVDFEYGDSYYSLYDYELFKIVKHSPNIIDLIEESDYVNGSKVIDIVQAPVKAIYTEDIEQKLALIPIVNEQIKNIVTKELFNQVKYEV